MQTWTFDKARGLRRGLKLSRHKVLGMGLWGYGVFLQCSPFDTPVVKGGVVYDACFEKKNDDTSPHGFHWISRGNPDGAGKGTILLRMNERGFSMYSNYDEIVYDFPQPDYTKSSPRVDCLASSEVILASGEYLRGGRKTYNYWHDVFYVLPRGSMLVFGWRWSRHAATHPAIYNDPKRGPRRVVLRQRFATPVPGKSLVRLPWEWKVGNKWIGVITGKPVIEPDAKKGVA